MPWRWPSGGVNLGATLRTPTGTQLSANHWRNSGRIGEDVGGRRGEWGGGRGEAEENGGEGREERHTPCMKTNLDG